MTRPQHHGVPQAGKGLSEASSEIKPERLGELHSREAEERGGEGSPGEGGSHPRLAAKPVRPSSASLKKTGKDSAALAIPSPSAIQSLKWASRPGILLFPYENTYSASFPSKSLHR